MKRARLCMVAILVSSLCGAGLGVAQQPPRDLHQVGDHWTAWDPPTEFPEGAEVHIVVPGDTLWGLASQYYGDPYLWPQLWERNQYILDAHWIYPGDPVVISVEVTPIEDLGEIDLGEDDMEGEEEGLRLGVAVSSPRPLGTEDDIYCSGYIGPLGEDFAYHLIGSEVEATPQVNWRSGGKTNRIEWGESSTRVTHFLGDIVYLDGGRQAGLSPGLVYTVVQPEEEIVHPHSGETIGQMYTYRGRVRVLTAQETLAIGEVIQACDAILVGSGIKPFVPEPVPLGRRSGVRPPNIPSPAESLSDAPVIVSAKDTVNSLGEDHVVFIDRGIDDGLAPGDIYTVYRINQPGLPPVVVGELAVLSVHEGTSVAKIIESRYTIFVGDRLEPK